MSNELIDLVYDQKPQFLKVLSDSTLEFEREASFAVQIVMANDYLCKIALNNRDSVRNAVTNVAAIGISLNPASKLAYLVPRKGAVCLDISYMGLMHIAQQSGAIKWGQAMIVRATDTFVLNGIDKPPTHTFNPFDDKRGEIVGVYVVVKTDEGDYLTHPMAIADVYAIRDRSEAWKSYVKDNSKRCPWNTDEQEMVKKTCVKQAAKYWPRRDRLDSAVHHLNTDGAEGVTLEPAKMSEEEFAEWHKKIEATTQPEAAKEVWMHVTKICKELGDLPSFNKLKEILVKHLEFIKSADKVAA